MTENLADLHERYETRRLQRVRHATMNCGACAPIEEIIRSSHLPFGITCETLHGGTSGHDAACLLRLRLPTKYDPINQTAWDEPIIQQFEIPPPYHFRENWHIAEWFRSRLLILVTHEIDEQFTLPGGERPFNPHQRDVQ